MGQIHRVHQHSIWFASRLRRGWHGIGLVVAADAVASASAFARPTFGLWTGSMKQSHRADCPGQECSIKVARL